MPLHHHEDPPAEPVTLSVPGMTCRHCARAVSARLADVPGVVAVEADVRSASVRVFGAAPPEALCAAVADAGHQTARLPTPPNPAALRAPLGDPDTPEVSR